MTGIAKYTTPSLSTILSTELNSLATNTMSAASSVLSANIDTEVDIEVVLASLSPASGAYVSIYMLLAVDGSNYPSPSDADLRLQTSQLLCTIQLGIAASTAQRVVIPKLSLPPGSIKFKLDNQSGVTLGASGNTVKFNIYDYNLNA